MNDASEHDIDRVLTALRDTEPTEGLEARILQALENRTPVRSTWFRRTSPMQWGLALTTAAVVLAIALTAHNTHHTAPGIAQSPVLMPSQNTVISTEASRLHATRSGEIAAFSEAGATHTPAQPSSTPTQPTYPPHELLCDCDPLAMADMQAPSQPAPPMPLSRDEQILRRAAQRGEQVQIALLEPLRDAPQRAQVPTAEDTALQHAVQGFLRQLAAAETLNPTPPTPDHDEPVPDTSSLTNPN